MMPRLEQVKYADLQGCCDLSFNTVYCILVELTDIRNINFDPKDSVADVSYWEMLLRTFTRVHFGHNVRCAMPFYANTWRIPNSDESE